MRHTLRTRPDDGHKGTFGHALLVAGSRGIAGAAILSAKGCLRSGIGKLTIHSAGVNAPILQAAVPEAVLLLDNSDDAVSQCHSVSSYDAIGIGPGLGRTESSAVALRGYLLAACQPMVLDADALNMVAEHKDLLPLIPHDSILTPHPKELERLVGQCLTGEERLRKAIGLAASCQLYVVVKGHNTAICLPDGQVRVCDAGNSGMATAGSGDVLTGIITGLLAQGYKPVEAASLGVWLHAVAGDFAAEVLEPECMLASDIVAKLPDAFRRLKKNNIT